MKRDVNTLCKAINLADYDKLETVEVLVGDLMLLRNEILTHNPIVAALKKELSVVRAKLALRDLEKPIKLDTYC